MKILRFCTLLILSCCIVFQLNAQLVDGSNAPDWTATDLDGNEWTLSEILNSGKHVVIDFAAAWCGLCWNYHQTGIIETLHEMYGPNGTDQIRVFFIEADLDTNADCLYGQAGCNVTTFGSWVEGSDHPFINIGPGNANSMKANYAVNYYPLTYAISASNNTIYQTGAPTDINTWNSWLFESFEMAVSATIIDAVCPGEGSIEVSTTNGVGAISYEWSDNLGTTNFVDNLEVGSYTVTVTDENGYQIMETYVVDGPNAGPVQVDYLSSIDVGCNGDESGELEVIASGGNGGYSYAWSNGASGSSITGLAAGDYSVVVTDSEGCTGSEIFSIFEPNILTLSIQTEDANCDNEDGQVEAETDGGIPPMLYDYGNGVNNTGVFINIEPGEYVMTVTDINGCVDVSPFSINNTESPIAIAEAESILTCSNSEIILSGQGSSEGDDIEYSWLTEQGFIVDGADEINATVDAAGTYTLIVSDTSTGCTDSVDVMVEADVEAPIVMIQDPETLDCNTESATLDASGSSEGENFSFLWSSDDGNIINGANENMALIDAPGTYDLLITNTDNGCTAAQSVVVSLHDESPEITVADQIIDCTNSEVELCADVANGTSVTWTTQNGEVEATCITVSIAGTYLAEAIGENGCISTAESIVSLSTDLPQVSISEPETLTCTVTSVTLEAALEGDPEDFDILWTSPVGEEINDEDLSLDVDEAGQYTLVVSNPANGCTTTSIVVVDQVIVNPESAFTTTLNNGLLILNSTSTGDPISYNWSFGSTEENTVTTFEETGTYEICLTVMNDCGEDTYCEEVYFVSQLLFESSTGNVLCFGENQGSITVEPSGGEPGYSISWVGPNGFTSTELSIMNLSAGDYNMVLSDSYGYEKSASYTISEPDAIIESSVAITDDTNNDTNGSITLEVEGGTGELSYAWSNGAITSNISELVAGDYSVVVTDENGCTKEFGPYTVLNTIVGVEDLEFVNSMRVFPNPASEYVNVSVELNEVMNTQMRVIDTYGKVISVQKFKQKNIDIQLELTNIPSGVYFIEFGSYDSKSLEKFVVIK